VKLAKYGSELDGPWIPGDIDLTTLPTTYQKVISLTTGDISTYIQTLRTVLATKMCNSCHNPADEGADQAITINGINCGPQGSDSRAYVGDQPS